MIEAPHFAVFAAALAEPRFIAAAAISALAGLVRGFSGFGSALIYMPLIAAVYDPKIAAVTLLLIDTACSLPFTLQAIPRCNWREVAPVSAAAAVAVPFGAMALVLVDPLLLRWLIAVLVTVALIALGSGWRYHGRPCVTASLGVGLLAGFGAGAVQIGAPPLLVFWLGGNNDAATVRANLMAYFIAQGALLIIAYTYNDLLTPQALALSLLLAPPFMLTIALGTRTFRGASDALYRRVAYVIIATAVAVSLPVFDALR